MITFNFKEVFEDLKMPLIKLYIKDKEYNFVVDTGADECYIDSNLAEELELPVRPIHDYSVFTASGVENRGFVYTVRFGVKPDCPFIECECMGTELRHLNELYNGGIQGLIGNNLLDTADAIIDYGTKQILLGGVGNEDKQ